MKNKSITFLVAYVDRWFLLPKVHMIAAPCLENAVKLFLQRIQDRGIEPSRVLAVEMFEYDGNSKYPEQTFLGFMRDDGSMVIERAPEEYSGHPFDARHFSCLELIRLKLNKYLA